MARGQQTGGLGSAQLGLPFLSFDEPDGLKAELEQASGRSLALVLTENVRSLLSLRPGREGVAQVRLHKMFLQAPSEVIAELGQYIRTRKGRTPLFWRFVQSHSHLIGQGAPRRTTLRTGGAHHDLAPMFEAINIEMFQGRIKCDITWGQSVKGRVRRRTLGSYSTQARIIRINPVLDSKSVPSYYIGFIIYHEMLHADMGIGELAGRRLIHPREFREREKLYPHYSRAIAYEQRRR